MKYRIVRDGRTIVIGHCKDSELRTDIAINRTVDEIRRRLIPNKFGDNGVTYAAYDDIRLYPEDEIDIRTEFEAVTVKMLLGSPVVLERRPLSITEIDSQI